MRQLISLFLQIEKGGKYDLSYWEHFLPQNLRGGGGEGTTVPPPPGNRRISRNISNLLYYDIL